MINNGPRSNDEVVSHVYQQITYSRVPTMCYILQIQIHKLHNQKSMISNIPTLQCSQWPALRSSKDAELSVCTTICSSTIGWRKLSPQLQTLKPSESRIMGLTRHWIKPRKNTVGSMPLPPLKSCLGFLLFCCYKHFKRLLNIVFPIKFFFVLFLFSQNLQVKCPLQWYPLPNIK